ncbi:MAG: hypothetical protein GC181_12590 [Bacteroidetes bacterium]|nr:hypothetical protein [Bacteroidota bacterium]
MKHKHSIKLAEDALVAFIEKLSLSSYKGLCLAILGLKPPDRILFYESIDCEKFLIKTELQIDIQRRLGNLCILKLIGHTRSELERIYMDKLLVCRENFYSTKAIMNSLLFTMNWCDYLQFDERIPYSVESAKALTRLCKDLNKHELNSHTSNINITVAETASLLGRIGYDVELLFKMEDLLLADEVYGELNSSTGLDDGIILFPFKKSHRSKYVQRLLKLQVERIKLKEEAQNIYFTSSVSQPELFVFKTSSVQTISKTDGVEELELNLQTFRKLIGNNHQERKDAWQQIEKELYPKFFELFVNKSHEYNYIQKIASEYQSKQFKIGRAQFSGNEILLATCAIVSYAQIIWTFNKIFNKEFLKGLYYVLKNEYGKEFKLEADFQVWALRSIQDGWQELVSVDGFELTVVREEAVLISTLRRVPELNILDDTKLSNLLRLLSGQEGGLLATPLLHLGKNEYLIPINNFFYTNYLSTVYQGFISKHMYDSRKGQNKNNGLDKLREHRVLERLEQRIRELGAKVLINHTFEKQIGGEFDLIFSFPKEEILIIIELKLINCESEKFSRELHAANEGFLKGLSQLERDLEYLLEAGSFQIRKKLCLPKDWVSKWDTRTFLLSDSYTVDRRTEKIKKWDKKVIAISLFEFDQIVQELATEQSSNIGARLLQMIDENIFWSGWQKNMNLNLDQKTISFQNRSLELSLSS